MKWGELLLITEVKEYLESEKARHKSGIEERNTNAHNNEPITCDNYDINTETITYSKAVE